MKLDPEDPRCVRLSLTGTVANVTDAAELAFAKKGLISVYPDMANWPASHGFHVVKLQIENIWLIDFFGGAKNIAPKDYFAESLTATTCLKQGDRKCSSDTVVCAYDHCEPCCGGLECYHDDDAGDFCIKPPPFAENST